MFNACRLRNEPEACPVLPGKVASAVSAPAPARRGNPNLPKPAEIPGRDFRKYRRPWLLLCVSRDRMETGKWSIGFMVDEVSFLEWLPVVISYRARHRNPRVTVLLPRYHQPALKPQYIPRIAKSIAGRVVT